MGDGQASFAFGKLLTKAGPLIGTVLRPPARGQDPVTQRFGRGGAPAVRSGLAGHRPPLSPLGGCGRRPGVPGQPNESFGKVLIDVA